MKDLIKSQITEDMTREQIVAIRKRFVMVQTNTDKIVIAPTPWMNNSQGEEIYTEGMVLINGKGKVEHRVK